MSAKRKTTRKRKPRKPKEAPVKPLKIVGCQLVGGRFNEHGELVDEVLIGDPSPFAIYAPDFKRVPQLVAERLKQATEADGE